MDTQTSYFYKRYAETLTNASEAQRSAMLPYVERSVRVGAAVLDVGSGSGRDLAAMLALGLNAFGVEPNEAMREKALSLHPVLGGRLRQAMLPSLGRPFAELVPDGFDAVICSAVLMHLDPAELPLALASMVDQLRPLSKVENKLAIPIVLISLPRTDVSELSNDRDNDGRRFYNHNPEEVSTHLITQGMSLEYSAASDAVLASTGTLWHTLVFRRVW
jgi:SAM-dependent methyltransferase